VLIILGVKNGPFGAFVFELTSTITNISTLLFASYYYCWLLHVLVDFEKIVQFNRYRFDLNMARMFGISLVLCQYGYRGNYAWLQITMQLFMRYSQFKHSKFYMALSTIFCCNLNSNAHESWQCWRIQSLPHGCLL
jgi:hypothetical protein